MSGVEWGIRNMKKLAVCLAALLIFSSHAMAHRGGLDGHGGHHDRKQGNYHFHRGPLAGRTFASKAEALAALNKSAATNSAARQPREKQSEKGQTRE